MILLRHGQSEFNLHFSATRRDPGIPDPKLTPLGHQQAEEAAEALAGRDIRRIVVSPYTRALQTALPAARRLGLPLTVTPTVRERYAFVCDVGTAVSELRLSFPDLDFPALDEIWWPAVEEPADQVEARAALFRAEMAALDDWQHTLVVSHWGFILALTGQSVMNGQMIELDPTAPGPDRIVWRA
ncbi:histidine phosphatase family protein [Sabulicella glaciei]|uniref:Histidine phosphatase family protein n=1 Tax=Sabulicella glaciei TaxID=2984948 RepID=A0ABT3P0J5_9PROT|nr:histidine phosphatase family protein [Roseococcus sp. MDT2-1-1]MCW8087942.1 histidine phosphatase family protein [Roseococcus sp. MDT2-1-1]